MTLEELIVHDADKEKTKLLATALNNLAVATVTIGFVTPLIAFLYKATTAPPIESVVALSGIWLATGAVLHLMALCPRKASLMTSVDIYAAFIAPLVLIAGAYLLVRMDRSSRS